MGEDERAEPPEMAEGCQRHRRHSGKLHQIVERAMIMKWIILLCSRPVGSLQAVKVGSMTCLVEATSICVCGRVNNEC
jgi:hypothetical protein